MTHMKNGKLVIEKEEPQRCEMCFKIAECRPYGINGAMVCCPCGMKNKEEAIFQLIKRIEGRHPADK